jgi:hypothetical protein
MALPYLHNTGILPTTLTVTTTKYNHVTCPDHYPRSQVLQCGCQRVWKPQEALCQFYYIKFHSSPRAGRHRACATMLASILQPCGRQHGPEAVDESGEADNRFSRRWGHGEGTEAVQGHAAILTCWGSRQRCKAPHR